ncbi:MAG TPA: GGDEF domain-containing protein [Candidatus Baltobacteraceae bacterium]|jgi:diguanylate cyclase (GGDEF)-like protein
MANSGSRAPWLVALLVAVLVLPIVSITVYFTVGIERQIAKAQEEREGLGQLERLQTFFADASTWAQAVRCPGVPAAMVSAANARTEQDLSFIEDPGPRRAWRALRATGPTDPALDHLFSSLYDSTMSLSDQTGLTFDPAIAGIDLSDSLAYRIPNALDGLQRARRMLCTARGPMMTIAERVALVKSQTRAEQAMADNTQDVSDALARDSTLRDVAGLSSSLRRAQADAAIASDRLDRLVTETSPRERTATVRALDSLVASLYALWHEETPVFRTMIALRIDEYGRQRLIALVPGLIGVVAAVLVAFLTMRLIYEHAAKQVAEHTAAEHEHTAMHDHLTGLLNRRAFMGVLQRASESGSGGVVCLFDLDDFKGINDTYGHLAGDDLLVNVARIIEASVRSTDAVARLGGDEFAVFLHSPIDRPGTERVLSAIANEAASPTIVRGETIRSSISAGAAMVDCGFNIEEVLAAADRALYDAKANARGAFRFGEMGTSA